MSKRILVFSTAYFPHVGGAEVAIKEITNRCEMFEFDLIAGRFDPHLPEYENIGSVGVYRVGIGIPLLDKLWLPWGGALLAHTLHKKNPYGLFWCMMATYGSGAAYVANFFFNPKIPIALTLQEGDSETYLRFKWAGLVDLSWRLAFFRSSLVTAISNYLGNRARRLGYSGPLEIIPNGVNTKHFSQEYELGELTKLERKLGKQHDDIYLITTSRLVKKNGISDVILALTRLTQNVKFLILGTGPDETILRDLAKKKGVESQVIFLGQINHADMPKYLKISDIFIRPSLSEGMGNSFIEAMAADLPVIATQEGGIADFLFDPDRNPDKKPTGLAVNPHDPEGIARQVKRFLEDKKLRDEIVKNARELAFAKYDWDKIARDMQEKVFYPLLVKSK